MTDSTILWTYTDEAPALATHSLLPVIRAYAGAAGIDVGLKDISLAARILSQFPDRLPPEQREPDALAELGEIALTPGANIVKLPNISASIPQLKRAIAELQAAGYDLPDYPDEPADDDERQLQAAYDRVKGSAVNPVLREGNSDRRAPRAVKEYAKANPHRMGAWSSDSRTHVATMGEGDFRANEQSVTVADEDVLRIEHVAADGTVTVRKEVPVLAGEVVDSTFMSVSALRDFFDREIADAKEQGVLFSLHMKATMMKVSDPIIFGHCIERYFADLDLPGDPSDGLAAILGEADDETTAAIMAAIGDGPDLAMVDSDRGITNLHVPSDVIIDASMPAMIRDSGKMWNTHDARQDCKATIPDSSYADLYQATIDHCREHGAFDPSTMGTVPNVGLMAKKAEEYGSHDKTFEVEAAGTMRVVASDGTVLMSHEVEAGDIWRACQVKDEPVRDWVGLAVRRARATGWPAVFWLDETRAHDAQVIEKVRTYLGEHDTDGLDIRIMDVRDAATLSLERARRGENTISVTGNVLRDYNTDLFPILELGTSAKMLSIVPLMNGGGLFETGAGGSAPKHVQQLEQENHLRWDSLGEFLALSESLEHYAEVTGNDRARVLSAALDVANRRYLTENRSPSRTGGEDDNRTSHVWLATYWARALADQTDDAALSEVFGPVAAQLEAEVEGIAATIREVQGAPVDLGGYYRVNRATADKVMRPSVTFNEIIDAVPHA